MSKGKAALRSVKGTRDLLPPETSIWQAVEATAREVFGRYGYGEVRTPILESTELFVRGVGEGTDVVGKEMYTFDDRKGRSVTMRPESTASVARAFIQHNLQAEPAPQRLFYVGPQFRYERPQKGRYRQFHQIGAELLGATHPLSDAELLLMLVRFLRELRFEDLTVLINTVGDEASREQYRETLVAYLEPHRESLGEDSQRRLGENPLRILDSKNPVEQEIIQGAPRLADSLSEESRQHFAAVTSALDRFGVSYRIEPRLVRGLDYYTETVFEIVSEGLGAQNAVCGGGRYNRLVSELGGPEVPGIGFAIGQDRLIDVLPESFRKEVGSPPPVVVVAVGEVDADEALAIGEELRAEGVPTVAELEGRSMRSALKRADRAGTHLVVLLGDDELADREVTLRDLREGGQRRVARSDIAAAIKEKL